MKKCFALLAMIVLGSGMVFARTSRASRGASSSSNDSSSDGERSVHVIGFDVPIWNQSWQDSEYSDDVFWNFSGAGFNVMYHHLTITPGRFSTFIDAELGYTSFELDSVEIDNEKTDASLDSMDGFNTRFIFGIGGAPLNNDRVSLAIHGTFGVNMLIAGNHEYGTIDGSSYDDEWSAFGFWTTIGANVESTVKITNHFGLFAGINMYINLYGFGVWERETILYARSEEVLNDVNDFCLIYPGDFNIDFRFGVAFIF